MADFHYTPIQIGCNATQMGGEVFGRLTVIAPISRSKNSQINWLCICECGSWYICRASHLTQGRCVSCGCFHREQIRKINLRHGMSGKSIHNIWINIIARCTDTNNTAYNRYGGRGIKVCDRWLNSFEAFYSDMGDRPSKNHSIDRIDNDGPYSPENCRWATSKEQARNKSNNRIETFNGKSMCIVEWSEHLGMPAYTILERMKRGWSFERAITTPVRRQ